MEKQRKVFDSTYIDQLLNDYSLLPKNQRPPVFYLCTNPDLRNDREFIEDTWQEIISSFKSNEFPQWLSGIRSTEDSQFWPFWFHFQLYDWLKKLGAVCPAPPMDNKADYHPNFTFSSNGFDFTIEARTFLLQGNDVLIERISSVIENILSKFKSSFWISFEILGFDHVTKYDEISLIEFEIEIRAFLNQWITDFPFDNNKEILLSNSIIIRFAKTNRGYKDVFSWSAEFKRQVQLHENRFICEIEEKLRKFSTTQSKARII